jgi:hypothetical protein
MTALRSTIGHRGKVYQLGWIETDGRFTVTAAGITVWYATLTGALSLLRAALDEADEKAAAPLERAAARAA